VLAIKPVYYISGAKRDMETFPEKVRQRFLHGLYLAQHGEKHADAKPLMGFGGSGVLEQVARFRGDTYRNVYTVRFPGAVYVLHAFQKKSPKGLFRKNPPRVSSLPEKTWN